jgi:hypothetical protein
VVAAVEVGLVVGGELLNDDVDREICLHDLVELCPVLRHAGHTRQRVRVQDQDHPKVIR